MGQWLAVKKLLNVYTRFDSDHGFIRKVHHNPYDCHPDEGGIWIVEA